MSGDDAAGSAKRDPAELIRQVASGDRVAFAELFVLLAPRIKAYLVRLGSDPASAEDLAQDVMISVWRKAPQFDPSRASAMTWAFVIARNRRIDSLRREDSAVTYGHVPPDVEAETLLADDIVAGLQGDARMREAIDELPADQQEVIRRSFFEDEPHSAIAVALNLPLGTVKSRLRIAFTKLRSRMKDFQ
ncbi:MAG: sigma-70 family RNA polymerase sigma factor [Novosphingobium sp.]|nr:sigma-70 family RNA polymerase sigma factor [Novosphingobium sp.]